MTDLQAILDGQFGGGAVPTAYYIGLIDANTFTAFAPAEDSMSSHPGWQEFTSYAGERPQWIPGPVIGAYPATISNPSPAVVIPTVNKGIVGIFLCDINTKGGTTGQLYGPWFFNDGVKQTVAGAPFRIDCKLILKRNTPWVN